MELKEVLLKRRSIRKFTAEPVSDSEIEEILHAAMSGPSACNRQPWSFYVITNPEVLVKLRDVTRFGKMNAPLAIVVCGNLSKALPFGMGEYWVQDCSAATENILLRVTDLGLGAVWCGVHPQKKCEDRAREILQLKDKEIPLNLIWIGHPDEERRARDWYDEGNIHYIK